MSDKTWRDIVAPTWGMTHYKEVPDLRWGWGTNSGGHLLDSGVNVGLLVLGGWERYPELGHSESILNYRFVLNQMFWIGSDNPKDDLYLQRLTEIQRDDNFWLYTVGMKVGADGLYSGGPACSYDEMVAGVCFVIDEWNHKKWVEYLAKKSENNG